MGSSFCGAAGNTGAGAGLAGCGTAATGVVSPGVIIFVPHRLQKSEPSGTWLPHRVQNVPKEIGGGTGAECDTGRGRSGRTVPGEVTVRSPVTGWGYTRCELTISIFAGFV